MLKITKSYCLWFTGVMASMMLLSGEVSARPSSSSVCATRPDVVIRDFDTQEVVGQLDQGECMEVVSTILHPSPAVRAQYLTVRGGISGRIRLISKEFVAYQDTPSYSSPSASYTVCANRPDVVIRDFDTQEVVGQLNYGECMEVVTNIQHSDPIIQTQYFVVRGGQSGKLRLLSKRFVSNATGD
jgi:hypothetical protein